MAFGLKVWGDSGALQIDDNYANYQIVRKGTLTISQSGNSYGTGAVSVTGTAPLIAWTGGGYAAVVQTARNGSTWTFNIGAYCPSPITLTYYIFDQIQGIPQAGSYGLRVFKPDGSIAFDSNYGFARISSVISSLDNQNNSQLTYTYDASRLYAVMNLSHPQSTRLIAAPGTPQDPRPRNNFTLYNCVAQGLQGAVQAWQWNYYNYQTIGGTGGSPGNFNQYGSFLVFDVTNF